MVKHRWKIHKFGGSSLADAECFNRVAKLLLDYSDVCMGVVVSAMGGMTDALIHLAVLAERDDRQYADDLAAIGERYSTTARALLNGEQLVRVLDDWGKDADDIRNVLQAIALVKSAPQRSRDVVSGYGEIWSARLLAAVLESASPERGGTWVDARRSWGPRSSGTNRGRALQTMSRTVSPASRLSPVLSPAMRTICRPRSDATAATFRPRFLRPSVAQAS